MSASPTLMELAAHGGAVCSVREPYCLVPTAANGQEWSEMTPVRDREGFAIPEFRIADDGRVYHEETCDYCRDECRRCARADAALERAEEDARLARRAS